MRCVLSAFQEFLIKGVGVDVQVIARLLDLYEEMDRQTAALQAVTGLCCPPGCGTCCSSGKVEATVLEMVPAARDLVDRGEAVPCLERLRAAGGEGICVFYQPERSARGEGCCAIYAVRPCLCRLFGFGAVTTKYGAPELAACAVMKEVMPRRVQEAAQSVKTGLPTPVFTDFTRRVAGIEPSLDGRFLPINRALQLALEREGLARELETGREAL
jgi:Fe-S-cluster containining protein